MVVKVYGKMLSVVALAVIEKKAGKLPGRPT
jgi:hypothetical protein